MPDNQFATDDEIAAHERAAAHVARGAALLDLELQGWWDVLDLDAFTISDSNQCVIGQLAQYDMESFYKAIGAEVGSGNYAWGVTVLSGITHEKPLSIYNAQRTWAYEHGFETGADDYDITYAMLQEAWAAEIASRRHTTVALLLEEYPDLFLRVDDGREDDGGNDEDDEDEDEDDDDTPHDHGGAYYDDGSDS